MASQSQIHALIQMVRLVHGEMQSLEPAGFAKMTADQKTLFLERASLAGSQAYSKTLAAQAEFIREVLGDFDLLPVFSRTSAWVTSMSASEKPLEDYTTVGTSLRAAERAMLRFLQMGALDPSPPPSDRAFLRVRFLDKSDSAIGNVTELKDWSARWHLISRAAAEAHNLRPEDVEVEETFPGSIVVTLCMALVVAKTMSNIAGEAFTIIERYLKIRAQAESLRGLQLDNEEKAVELIRLLEDQADQALSAPPPQSVDAILKADGLDAHDGERRNVTEFGLREMTRFLLGGGKLTLEVGRVSKEAAQNPPHTYLMDMVPKLEEMALRIESLQADLKLLAPPVEDETN